jgi:hypothetical protein
MRPVRGVVEFRAHSSAVAVVFMRIGRSAASFSLRHVTLEIIAVGFHADDGSRISEIVERERIASCVGHFVVAAVDVIGQNPVVVLR